MDQNMLRRAGAEFFGTFWLVFGGCGAALLSAAFPQLGIGFLGVALAFGLSVLVMIYAVGRISGGHFNPAVTLGLWSARCCDSRYLLPYLAAQLSGAATAAVMLYMIASGREGADLGSFAANGYGALSPNHFGLVACFLTETVTTFFFVFVIVGATRKGPTDVFAGLAIGLCLTLIHLISIPVTNTSVNPARSTVTAVFAGNAYLSQLWLFWLAPMAGAVLAGVLARWFYEIEPRQADERVARFPRPFKTRRATA